jgi:hypothetical protein
MRKRGQIKEIHGDKALVKTLSVKALGCPCCGGLSCRSFEELEVENLCRAREGDWVIFEVEVHKEKTRSTLLTLGTFIAVLFGACLVQALLKALGWTSQKIIPFALGFGLAAGAVALVFLRIFYRKHPLKPAAATQVIPAPEEKFEEKLYLI